MGNAIMSCSVVWAPRKKKELPLRLRRCCTIVISLKVDARASWACCAVQRYEGPRPPRSDQARNPVRNFALSNHLRLDSMHTSCLRIVPPTLAKQLSQSFLLLNDLTRKRAKVYYWGTMSFYLLQAFKIFEDAGRAFLSGITASRDLQRAGVPKAVEPLKPQLS